MEVLVEKSLTNGTCSIAMFDYRRVNVDAQRSSTYLTACLGPKSEPSIEILIEMSFFFIHETEAETISSKDQPQSMQSVCVV